AGNITVQVSDRLRLRGSGTGFFADTESGSTGSGGSIFIDPRTVQIQDGAEVAVGSRGTGQGGNIRVNAGTLLLDRGFLSAETSSAQGGDIALQLRDLLLLRRGSLISTTAGTAQAGGNGGNISIVAPFVIAVLSENSDIRANAFTGRGGNVTITAQSIFGIQPQQVNTPRSDITASSQFGISGDVVLNTLNVDPSRGLVPLPTRLIDPSGLIDRGCTAATETTSEFVVTGRGGLPPSPNDPLSNDALWEDNRLLSSSHSTEPRRPAPPAPIAATGWTTNSRGEVVLVAASNQSPSGIGAANPCLQPAKSSRSMNKS
ncbi:S-layer family protein, partial [Leptolyngbya sp. FACHB-36]|uniref:S-layer family protein n=1 Tax=Leptolyngbya sp. FACHB-36 TaxID=2692808 RepID=UPI0016819E5E